MNARALGFRRFPWRSALALAALPLGCGLLAPLDPLPDPAAAGGTSGSGGEGTGTAGDETGGQPEGGSTRHGGAGGTMSTGGAAGTPPEGGDAGARSIGGASNGGAGGGGGTSGACGDGDIAGCRCPDDAVSYRPCEKGRFGACVCPGSGDGMGGESGASGSAGTGALSGNGGSAATGGSAETGGSGGGDGCIPEEEWCDGHDNDCNDIADDHFACPNDSVSNTEPFEGGVYFLGSTVGTGCGPNAVQQLWPTVPREFTSGLPCYADWFRFNRFDDTLYVHDPFVGIRRYTSSETATVLTPPCGSDVRARFDFDDAGVIHYQCADRVRRGNGENVGGPIETIEGVLSDGRIIVTKNNGFGYLVYAVLSRQGVELNRFPPTGFFTGEVAVVLGSVTVQGNNGYVALHRVYNQETNEAVVYEVDADSNFRLVRRVVLLSPAVVAFWGSSIVLSDGTVLVPERDESTDPSTDLVRAYLPDNTNRVVWRSAEAANVYPYGWQFSVGPRLE